MAPKRFIPPTSRKGTWLPSLEVKKQVPAWFGIPQGQNAQLPNASIVYGIGAAALFAVSLYFLFTGVWFTGILLWLPAGALLGFALHFLSYSR